MQKKLKRRILRNLKLAREEMNQLIENLEDETTATGFGYTFVAVQCIQENLAIVSDLVKDDLRTT